MSEIYGYFNWRHDQKGQPYPEKLMTEFVDGPKLNSNKDEGHKYLFNLIKEFPLNEKQFELSLANLSELFPCPKFQVQDYYGEL